MINTKIFNTLIVFIVVCAALVSKSFATEKPLPFATIGEDGLYQQEWFHDSFLDLRDDVKEAKAKGKHFVIFWEQKNCPYCKQTHQVNLRVHRIVQFISDHFLVVHLNLWGDKEITDFDGEITTEKKLAQKWAIKFTPTIQFFSDKIKSTNKKPGNKIEILRVPGYFKPFHFYFLFKYIKSKSYQVEPNFQRWLSEEGDKLATKGVDVQKQLWADQLLFD
jgi:thioredoxin-related protein